MEMNSSPRLTTHAAARPTAGYHPNVWGDRFLLGIPDDSQTKKLDDGRVVQELIEEIRVELMSTAKTSMQRLELIDSIQRLGIEYHFEMEIEQTLQTGEITILGQFQMVYCIFGHAALSFRLLRQHGYRVSCSIFEKFKDAEGQFTKSITSDMKGMLELYEASHLIIHGEDILDEALAFTRHHLSKTSCSPNLEGKTTYLVDQTIHALKEPYRRGITRLEARAYITIYEKNPSHNKTLLKLAKLDFNGLQSMHKKELSEICRWWKGFDVPNKLSFARDRVVEGYFWILGIYFEPQYVLARKIMTKVIAITSIFDDIYDAYGTFEELEIFTEAFERWSSEYLDRLPEPLQICYKGVLELYEEIEEEMNKLGKLYRIDYGKEAIKIVARAYMEEAKWREQNYTPTTKEYMSVATQSCAYRSLVMTSYLGMGDVAAKEHFQWTLENPKVVRAASVICRLKDDIVGHEFEQKRKHIGSAVDWYVKEHKTTREEAINEFDKQIEAAWKDLNEGFLKPTQVPRPLLDRVINFARVIEMVYKEGDWYTHVSPEMKVYIEQILIDPVPI